nr:hypothetical protein HmN_000885400 [Hymenolepis microstoma]
MTSANATTLLTYPRLPSIHHQTTHPQPPSTPPTTSITTQTTQTRRKYCQCTVFTSTPTTNLLLLYQHLFHLIRLILQLQILHQSHSCIHVAPHHSHPNVKPINYATCVWAVIETLPLNAHDDLTFTFHILVLNLPHLMPFSVHVSKPPPSPSHYDADTYTDVNVIDAAMTMQCNRLNSASSSFTRTTSTLNAINTTTKAAYQFNTTFSDISCDRRKIRFTTSLTSQPLREFPSTNLKILLPLLPYRSIHSR